jgi:hypothetical protein
MAYPNPPLNLDDHFDFIVLDPLLYEKSGYFYQMMPLKPSFEQLRNLLKRIYNMNESSLREASDATTGLMGKLNRRDTEKRVKRFNDKIDKGFRDFNNPHHKVILAEGDSWFNFPVFVNDIIDYLSDEKDFAVYSMAYGGDWIANIIYEEKYVEELSVINPDVFLISGAGNDMVGNSKVALMVSHVCHPAPKFSSAQQVSGYWDNQQAPKTWMNYMNDKQEIYEGHLYLTNRFYSFILVIKANYYKILENLNNAGEFAGKMVITQGYDYAIPCLDDHFSFRYPLEFFINKFLDTGKWLSRPMALKGIFDAPGNLLQRKVVKAMIFFLNEMFIELVTDKYFNNINCFHLDNRYIADKPGDWYDELHLKNYKFEEIATAYSKLIKGQINTGDARVIAAKDWV